MLALVLQSRPPGHAGNWPLVSAVNLDPVPAAVPCVRRHTVRMLRAWNLSHLADSAQLAVSELVTNALIHGTGPVTVRLRAHQASLLIEVCDSLPVPPMPGPHAVDVDGGRGLEIVSRLSDCWGYYPKDGGKAVWALLCHSRNIPCDTC